MNIETLAIDAVKRLERNPRKHPEAQIEALMNSVTQFGQYRPLVVDEDGVILAGNGLYEALQRLGKADVRVHRIEGLTQVQKNKLILADNRTGDMSRDDFEIVDEMIRSLDDFDIPGYDPETLREMFGDTEEILENADSYGVLEDDVRERLQERRESLAEARNEATVGDTPPQAVKESSVDTEAPTERTGTVCPTCRRAW